MRLLSMLFCALLVLVCRQDRAPGDLSSPKSTVQSFVTALDNDDYKQAAACVLKSQPSARFGDAIREALRVPHDARLHVTAKMLVAETQEHSAVVAVQYSVAPNGMERAELTDVADFLQLVKEDNAWRIVPDSRGLKGLSRGTGFLSFCALALADPEGVGRLVDTGMSVSCVSNGKQIALGMLMYVQDYDERFPHRADQFKSSIMPYIKNEQVFHCPSDPGGPVSYSFNYQLQAVPMARVAQPANTVLIYEGSHSKLNFRHDGRATVAFADGHVKLIGPEQAKTLRWKP